MARQLRVLFESAFYHVTARGNQRSAIFFDQQDRRKFLDILRRTKQKSAYLLHGYALMDNHYHLLLETPRANLSRIMQTINTSYTVYINRRYRRSGHLFQGRFKAILVDKDEYLLQLSRYIHLNPVRAKVVKGPAEYPWTSYHQYIKGETDILVDAWDTLLHFGKSKLKARRKYRAFVEGEEIGGDPFQNLTRGILGDEGFLEKVRTYIGGVVMDNEIPRSQRLKKEITLTMVVEKVASFYKRAAEAITRRGKGKPEREAAVYLAKAVTALSNKEIGVGFGIGSSAVSEITKRVERRLDLDKRFSREIEALKRILEMN